MDTNDSAAMRELKAAAFETLLFFPGIDYESWCQVLLREYTSEVVDALGDDAETVLDELAELWQNGLYTDESTGITKPISVWASLLRNRAMVDHYYQLVDEANAAKDAQSKRGPSLNPT